MCHWERLCTSILGRCLWAVRYIPSGVYGDKYEWSVVVLREHWFSRDAKLMLASPMDMKGRRMIEKSLRERGFRKAIALRNGTRKTWT